MEAEQIMQEWRQQQCKFLRVTLACVPKESPNQNKDCLNYEVDLGKTTRQTRKWNMQIKEEKEQLCNKQKSLLQPDLFSQKPAGIDQIGCIQLKNRQS